MADNYQTAIIIPARYASTRFPGKPLAMLDGKPIIQHVWKTASAVCHDVYVATDDERIAKTVASFGGNAIMTSSDLRSGTDRIAQAYSRMTKKYDFIINIQGDEPFIHKEQISALMHCLEDNNAEIATVVKPFASDAPIESLENENPGHDRILREVAHELHLIRRDAADRVSISPGLALIDTVDHEKRVTVRQDRLDRSYV